MYKSTGGHEPRIDQSFLPSGIVRYFPDTDLLSGVTDELEFNALSDIDACSVYSSYANGGSNRGLVLSEKFARQNSALPMNGLEDFSFGFLQLSLFPQKSMHGLYVESNSVSGIGEQTLHSRSWRAILNLGHYARKMTYSVQPLSQLELVDVGGLRTCDDYNTKLVRSLILPPRNSGRVFGLTFCASEVLHGGLDDENGHFIASYGLEEPL
jgi:hypothetical protein